MASDLTFVIRDPTASPTAFLTLFAHEDDAAANNNLMWTSIKTSRPSPWELIHYPGSNSLRAKFMGARPRTYSVFGLVVAQSDADVQTAMDKIHQFNTTRASYTISSANIIQHDGAVGFVCTDVITELVGDGTGRYWRFEIVFTDLTTTRTA